MRAPTFLFQERTPPGAATEKVSEDGGRNLLWAAHGTALAQLSRAKAGGAGDGGGDGGEGVVRGEVALPLASPGVAVPVGVLT
jgi:hypothetical protein